MTQCKHILNHLNIHGSITAMEALAMYGCFRLAARINDLRNLGYAIHTERVKAVGKEFARYHLIENQQAA